MKGNFLKQCVSEFIGTFFLVFIGCGAAIVHQINPSAVPSFMVPIAFGGIVSVMVYTLGHISGAHFNPAVTVAFSVARHFPVKRVFGYVAAQVLGAIGASVLHMSIFGRDGHNFGTTALSTSLGSGIAVEITLSFLLMSVIVSVATDTRAVGEMAGLAIGTVVGMCAIFGGPLTGASMNPARSIGPAIASMNFQDLWVYLVFPVIGTVLGAVTYQKIRCDESGKDGPKGCC